MPRLLGLGGASADFNRVFNRRDEVEKTGIEPASTACKAVALPLSYNPKSCNSIQLQWQDVKELNPLAGVLEAPRSP